jgi:hypothetical protein
MSVFVDVEEVRAMVRGRHHSGFTGLEIKDKLSTTAKVAATLIKHGHLKTITVVNPVNRCPTVVVPAEEVERFGQQFISLFALATQLRRHFRKVKKELEAAGVEPVFNPSKIGATFYRSADAMTADDLPRAGRCLRGSPFAAHSLINNLTCNYPKSGILDVNYKELIF